MQNSTGERRVRSPGPWALTRRRWGGGGLGRVGLVVGFLNWAALPREWDGTEPIPPVGFRRGADAPGFSSAGGSEGGEAPDGWGFDEDHALLVNAG
jgi:hypothetical protein